MEFTLNFQVIADNWLYWFIGRYPNGPLGGIALTLYLATVSCFYSFFGGLILGILSVWRKPTVQWSSMTARRKIWVGFMLALKWSSVTVSNAVRGIPLLMVVFWSFLLWPKFIGVSHLENQSVIVALSLFTSAYMAQIVRAGIEGIPAGQTEAGVSTGLSSFQVMLFIVLPQGLRNMIPSFVNQFVSMIKDTSLAFIVGVDELMHVATQVSNRTLLYPTEIFLFVALVYFVICYAFTSLSRWLERRLAWRKAI